MSFSHSPVIGVNLTQINTVADVALMGGHPPHRIGSLVWGDNGLIYVYAKANATITAPDTDCTVNATTFLVTASGGSYTAPGSMVAGDYGWFSKAGV